MIETIIVPIVKNKRGNLCDSNNYRPIALWICVACMLLTINYLTMQ